MTDNEPTPLFIANTLRQTPGQEVAGEFVPLLGEVFYRISNYHAMEPFFMSLASSSDHWLFISSTGGLSAGRGSAEQALFPYYTEDKLAENSGNTGSRTILRVRRGGRASLWEPFSDRYHGCYAIERNLYKNVPGTALLFEETNRDLGLTCRYAWRTGEEFGFVKTTWLQNTAGTSCQVDLLDGLQNILPANVTSLTQNTFSPLLDAYKRAEVDPGTGLAIFSLNSTLTDLAEPSESLLATTAFQLGLDPAGYLLSSSQLDRFRMGEDPAPETGVRGRRGAYFVHADIALAPGEERAWHIAADVSQDAAAIVRLSRRLVADRAGLLEALEADLASNTAGLERIVAGADGLQLSARPLATAHHFANVMFNVMRGGTFADQYRIPARDFLELVNERDRRLLSEQADFFSGLPPVMDLAGLLARAMASGSASLVRLSHTCLPLSFSRRHGDPSRPWNRFSIDVRKPDGSLKTGYEGNWRDIFQNWEALAWSYPEYVESMIATFVNATTADGYNPYRLTHRGIDWEVPEPANPWANIGYWSDHQIVYLQKLLEISAGVHPGRLGALLTRPVFSHANVPYRIHPYEQILQEPYRTLEFDRDLERKIEALVRERGTDGKLVLSRDGQVLHTTLAEKLLILLLAKLANFVPEGGIWMNTQRPEWNDANNALVGKGLSVVTLCYLRRYLVFYRELLESGTLDEVRLSEEVRDFYERVFEGLRRFRGNLAGSFGPDGRRGVMDLLGRAGSDYRGRLYSDGFSGRLAPVAAAELASFLELAQVYVEHSLRANRRGDGLYHAYNILHLADGAATISRLDEMLEGQVAVLSSGLLTGEDSLALLESLRRGRLYRPDQHSYILYPDRDLPGFLEKNRLSPEQVAGLKLVSELARAGDASLFTRDEAGDFHFSGGIHNARDVVRILESLAAQPRLAGTVEREAGRVLALFEEIFQHDRFTGRSGTFFAYEGLGSIYWHMVSKLLLAVQETILRTRGEPSTGGLVERYTDIRQGLSFNKTPAGYGAFPTDPYSHTPKGQGARQPGMTGMVKEEILARQAELGMAVRQGCLAFDFPLLDRDELLPAPSVFSYWSVQGGREQLELPAGSLAWTICQVPVVIRAAAPASIEVHRADGTVEYIEGRLLDAATSSHIFRRDGAIHHLVVSCGS